MALKLTSIALLLVFVAPFVAWGAFMGHTAAEAGKPKYRVLFIGDSLTEGMVRGQENHPPAKYLLEIARKNKVPNFEVVEEGVSGELVVPTMVERAQVVLGAAQAAGRDYTHIVVEGGFNDISAGRSADDLFGGLLHIFKRCEKTGAHLIFQTLYGYNLTQGAAGAQEDARHGLNVLLRDYDHSYGHPGKLTLVDMDKLIEPSTKPLSGEATSYYSDAIHMTAEGYAYMGKLIWDKVFAPTLGASQR